MNQKEQKFIDSTSRKDTDKKLDKIVDRLVRVEKKVGLPTWDLNDIQVPQKMKPFSVAPENKYQTITER
jgi:hypothetical protein